MEQNNKNISKIQKLNNSNSENNIYKKQHLKNNNSHETDTVQKLHQIENINLDLKEISLSIFLNWSKFSKEEFQFLLSYQNLVKILKISKIMGDNKYFGILKTNELDILFKKINPNNKSFTITQFNNFIVHLSNKIFPKEFGMDAKICVSHLIDFITFRFV